MAKEKSGKPKGAAKPTEKRVSWSTLQECELLDLLLRIKRIWAAYDNAKKGGGGKDVKKERMKAVRNALGPRAGGPAMSQDESNRIKRLEESIFDSICGYKALRLLDIANDVKRLSSGSLLAGFKVKHLKKKFENLQVMHNVRYKRGARDSKHCVP